MIGLADLILLHQIVVFFSKAASSAKRHDRVTPSRQINKKAPPAGLEPATFGLEVQRAIHCATGAFVDETGLKPKLELLILSNI